MSEYVVLQQTGQGWQELSQDPVEARNDQHAIREATGDMSADDRSGTFVAVPARSFTPRTRKVQTVEKDVWS